MSPIPREINEVFDDYRDNFLPYGNDVVEPDLISAFAGGRDVIVVTHSRLLFKIEYPNLQEWLPAALLLKIFNSLKPWKKAAAWRNVLVSNRSLLMMALIHRSQTLLSEVLLTIMIFTDPSYDAYSVEIQRGRTKRKLRLCWGHRDPN